MTPNLLICLVGLPRAGKSTWARIFGKECGAPIVCPDAIRLALHGQRFYPPAEGMVWAIAHTMVRSLFLAGHETVIVDSTANKRERRDFWQDDSWQTRFHVIATSKDECIQNAVALGDTEIIPIIERMAEQHEPLGEDEDTQP